VERLTLVIAATGTERLEKLEGLANEKENHHGF
jgi:hypothetical protein